ncbi:unnamed protein product [Schistosoma margrebowiei]|uniref:Uncharacterized protein n=1 Tax=Schistosoma margrebowiei TaxID=48269 RepID=A0A183N9G1_9TREM|nr:unnamed protein product [Schistosoma margrebowiei]
MAALLSGNMKLALIYFNKCVELCLKYNLNSDKRLAVIYRNRSLIYLQLNEYQLACNDCTSALSIESNCPIALYRRALALKFLGDHSGCLKDLQKAYNLSPNNNRIIEELKKMQNTLVQTDVSFFLDNNLIIYVELIIGNLDRLLCFWASFTDLSVKARCY